MERKWLRLLAAECANLRRDAAATELQAETPALLSPTRNRHLKGGQHDMNLVPVLVDAVKAPMRRGIATGHVVAVVGKLLARREAWRLADDLVAFNHQAGPVGVLYDPLPAQQGHGAIGGI